MTPDAAGIEAALAAGLAAHERRWRGAWLRCSCGNWVASSAASFDHLQVAEFRAHVAAALLPVVTQAQAEALREAADAVQDECRHSTTACFCGSADWLRARADESGA